MTTSGHSVGNRLRRHDQGRDRARHDHQPRVGHALPLLEDIAVVVRHPDGSFTLDREASRPLPTSRGSPRRLLAGLVLGVPLAGAAMGAMVGGAGATVTATVGIADDFVRDVERLMKPGTSALFVLDSEGDMEAILHGIRGLGGTVMKTNVDVERARLIQSTLNAA